MAKRRISLVVLLIVPALIGMVMIGALSWRMFTPAVDRSSGIALAVLESMIRTTGSEALAYPLASGNRNTVRRIVSAMVRNDLVFAVQVEDTTGAIVARAQNPNVPVSEGVRLIERREPLIVTVDAPEFTTGGEKVFAGEVVYQLTPYVLTAEASRLVEEYQLVMVCVLLLAFVALFALGRALAGPTRAITNALKKIGEGEDDVQVSARSFVAELEVVRKGVNRLSEKVADSRARQVAALDDLEAAAQRAEQSDRESRSFFEAATREIEEPVSSIVELLKLGRRQETSTVNPETVLELAEKVQLSVAAMLGRLAESSQDRQSRAIKISAFFRQLEQSFRARFEMRQIGFFVDRQAGPINDEFLIDARTLTTILEKIIENALQHTPRGEVRITWSIEDRRDENKNRNENPIQNPNQNETERSELCVSVKDNGVGIDVTPLERVFDRYASFADHQGNTTRSGLGLYIARTLMTMLGGTLTVKSQVNIGSEFVARVPIEAVAAGTPDNFRVAGTIALSIGLSAEDRAVLEAILASNELVNLHSDVGVEALSVIAEHDVDVVIIDESLSDIPADALISELNRRRPGVHVVIVCEAGSEYVADFETIQRPVEYERSSDVMRSMTERRSAGVDYRLRDRLKGRIKHRSEDPK